MEIPLEHVVGRAVALTTGIEYIPELDAVIDMSKFRAQLEIPRLERAVVEAAIVWRKTGRTYSRSAEEAADIALGTAIDALIQAREV